MISSRPECRSGELRCRPETEAEALYCQGNHAEATRNQMAEAMEVNPSTLGNWLDPQHHSRIPDERKVHVLRLTDDHDAYIRYLAAVQGLVVYDPKTAAGKNVTRLVSEFSDLLKALDDARAVDGDGGRQITRTEALEVQEEARQLHAVIDAQVRQVLIEAGLLPVEDAQ